MADKKITQLTQHTSVINSDLLAVVDVTATETKKLAIGTLRDFTNQGLLSSSAQIANDISGAFSSTSASLNNYITNVSSSFSTTLDVLTFDQLADVNNYDSSSIPNGYHIEWQGTEWMPVRPDFEQGKTRLFVAAARSNTNPFYFNSQTRTSDTSASPVSDSAFMLVSGDLDTITFHLRSSTSVSATVDILKNIDGAAFSTATSIVTPQTIALTADTVSTFTFSGLTLNQFDAIHVKCTPGGAGDFYGIVEIV